MRARLRCAVVVLAAVAMIHSIVVWRSYHHLRLARHASASHRPIEAAREYQAAIGWHAPGNPFARRAVEDFAVLIDAFRADDPELARNLEDRLMRSVRGTRWLMQPHAEVLAISDPGFVAPSIRFDGESAQP
jgi:hypothetical protein